MRILFTLFLICLTTQSFSQTKSKAVPSSIVINKISSRILRKDSIFNVEKPIVFPTQPYLLKIQFYDKLDSLNANFVVVIKEIMTITDSVSVGNSNQIVFSNFSGGEYEIIIKNLHNHHQKHLFFKIKYSFWQRWWFIPLVFLIILLILGIVLYFFYIIRLRQQLRLQSVRYELEIKALRAQMNPHFIFNSMNTIDAYILRKKFVEASDCLQKFSKLIRQILENSENQTIRIAQELATLKLYIELEQERFSHSFSYQIDIQPELLEKDYQIPPLLIQPFVENAILHGIRHLTERKGEVLVKLSMLNEILMIEIKDNGIGRNASTVVNQQRQESHKSMGVDITMERIATYQALYGDKMETHISDLAEGTKVEMKLPLILV